MLNGTLHISSVIVLDGWLVGQMSLSGSETNIFSSHSINYDAAWMDNGRLSVNVIEWLSYIICDVLLNPAYTVTISVNAMLVNAAASLEAPETRMMTQTVLSTYFLWHQVTSMNAFSGNVAHYFIYFASAAVTVDSSHMTESLSASWSRFSPPSTFVNVAHWYTIMQHS